MFDRLEKYLSDKILNYLAQPTGRYAPFYAADPDIVRKALAPGDVLLVEGNSRLSATIKYLTQSTWSHAALYVGERPGDVSAQGEPNVFLEAEADTGVVTVPLSKYVGFNTRICRPVGLDEVSTNKVLDYALKRIGTKYDSQRIVDLARYLFPYPPVPVWFRRRMLSIGCGDPTRAICSTLIAQSFASIHYPILPERASINGKTYVIAPFVQSEIDHIRTYGLYTPRDFDTSPYFAIVKPTLAAGFDYRTVEWAPPEVDAADLAQAQVVAPSV
ncbi:MAG TPA: YiiX/YebB-like N1pC/P60 family cysteine hydrolase [Xanthobacteraceae bacterium]|nr:YiiX/YebB-like N1pC/P60 family cysteine hydrolase [Xanthobacteraceae bacterium]